MSWYWNEINDKDSARYATTPAVWVSYLIAALSGLVAIVSLVHRKPTDGGSGWAMVESGLFAVIGWQIGRLSRVWACIGLSVYLVEALAPLGTRGLSVGAIGPFIVGIVLLATYVNALRGTVAYHKFVKLQSAQPSESV